MRKCGYTQSEHDLYLFFFITSPTYFIFIGLSTDEFLVVATSMALITNCTPSSAQSAKSNG